MTPIPIPRARALEIIEGKLPELARLQTRRPEGEWFGASAHKVIDLEREYALLPEPEKVRELWVVWIGEVRHSSYMSQIEAKKVAEVTNGTVVHMREVKPLVVTETMREAAYKEYRDVMSCRPYRVDALDAVVDYTIREICGMEVAP